MSELIPVKTLDREPFKNMVATIGNLPTSFVDSMSYFDMLAWLCKYIEDEIIPTVNSYSGAIEEVQRLYLELKQYVDDYFENLDVQEEINNKLDEMADSGELEEIISSYLNSNAIFGFNSVADMKLAQNFVDGSFARTLGFTTKGDGGAAQYKIRTVQTSDVIDERNIIAINEDLVAELVIKDQVTPEMFGAIGDGTTDDTVAFEKAIEKEVKIIGVADKTYNINRIVTDNDIDIEGCNFYSASEESATDAKMLFRTSSANVKFVNCKFSSTSDQIPVINQLNGQNTGLASNVMALRLNNGGIVDRCTFDNVYAIDTRGATIISNCVFDSVEMGVYINTDKGVDVHDCKFYMNRLVNSHFYHAMYIPSAGKFIANNIFIKEVNSGACGDHLHFRTSDGTGALNTPYAIVSNCIIEGDLTYAYISQVNNADVVFDNLVYDGTTNGAFIVGNVGKLTINNSRIKCNGETLFKCYNSVIARNTTFTLTANTTQLLSRCNLDMTDCVITSTGTINMNPDVGHLLINMFGCVFTASTINSLNVGGATNDNNILGCVYNMTSGAMNLNGSGYIEAMVKDGDYPTAIGNVEQKNCYKLAVLQSNGYYRKIESIVV